MNMQKLMQEAQKIQAQLQKEQKELEKTTYEGHSSLVDIKMNGKYAVQEVKINLPAGEDLASDDVSMLEDMITVALNEVTKKINDDKEKKMNKFGGGLSGLM